MRTNKATLKGPNIMKSTTAAFFVLATLTLSACLETGLESVPAAVPTGLNLTGPTATVCRAAIARQTNLSERDVAVFDVLTSEAGNQVQATVAGGEAPWICSTDRDNRVLQVMYSGSEGTL